MFKYIVIVGKIYIFVVDNNIFIFIVGWIYVYVIINDFFVLVYIYIYIYNWYNFYDVFFDNKNMLIVKIYIYVIFDV